MVEGGRFELPNPMGADLQSAAFSHFATPPTQATNYICCSRRNRTADTRIFSPFLYRLSYSAIMAIRTRLEPATSSVTGWHSNQLNYRTTQIIINILDCILIIIGCGGKI